MDGTCGHVLEPIPVLQIGHHDLQQNKNLLHHWQRTPKETIGFSIGIAKHLYARLLSTVKNFKNVTRIDDMFDKSNNNIQIPKTAHLVYSWSKIY